MPNWVKTIIRTKPSVIKDIITNYSIDNSLSFEKVIPMPSELLVEKSSRGDEGIALLYYESSDPDYKNKINEAYKSINVFQRNIYESELFKRVSNQYDKDDELNEEKKKIAEQYISNFEKYGFCDWYEWRVHNWGTKWDLSSFSYDKEKIVYETAWDFSEPILLELSKKYPEIIFDREFADEINQENSGSVSISSGRVIRQVYGLSIDAIERIWDTDIQQENKIQDEKDLEEIEV